MILGELSQCVTILRVSCGPTLTIMLVHADAYGPMLQGFRKVVCDCSRGAPVSEIVGNIVISAVRAAGLKK